MPIDPGISARVAVMRRTRDRSAADARDLLAICRRTDPDHVLVEKGNPIANDSNLRQRRDRQAYVI